MSERERAYTVHVAVVGAVSFGGGVLEELENTGVPPLPAPTAGLVVAGLALAGGGRSAPGDRLPLILRGHHTHNARVFSEQQRLKLHVERESETFRSSLLSLSLLSPLVLNDTDEGPHAKMYVGASEPCRNYRSALRYGVWFYRLPWGELRNSNTLFSSVWFLPFSVLEITELFFFFW